MEQFLNFHTHTSLKSPIEKSIYNILVSDIQQPKLPENQWISAGIHPWYATKNWRNQLKIIENLAVLSNVITIGECGLDRTVEQSLDEQLLIFDSQVKIAEHVHKPVVIHCVRAFNELIVWKKQSKPGVSLIVHGFNNNHPIVKELLRHGFYVSLGAALLNPQSNASNALKEIPLEKLFLENDNHEIPIIKIYEAAATQLEISVTHLKNQIWANFVGISNYKPCT